MDQHLGSLWRKCHATGISRANRAGQLAELRDQWSSLHTIDLGNGAETAGSGWDVYAGGRERLQPAPQAPVWLTAFSPDGTSIAAESRLSLYDYTIAVDGTPWQQTFGGVWEPVFNPVRGTVAAPVRTLPKPPLYCTSLSELR